MPKIIQASTYAGEDAGLLKLNSETIPNMMVINKLSK